MKKLAKHPTEYKLLRSPAGKLVTCGCDVCAHFADDLKLTNRCIEVVIQGVESTSSCSDCESINGTYYLSGWSSNPNGPLDDESLCGFNFHGSGAPYFTPWFLQCHDARWRIDLELNTRLGVTQADLQIEIAALIAGPGDHYDSALFGYVNWDYYFHYDPDRLPSDPLYHVNPTAAARDVIKRLCAGETVELPFVVLDAIPGPTGICEYSSAQVSIRIVSDQSCPAEIIECASEAYVELTVNPDCTWNWQVISSSGCGCVGTEYAVTDDMICIEITCEDGSTRVACTSLACDDDPEGDCASKVQIQTYCLNGVIPKWSATMAPGCACTVEQTNASDVVNYTHELCFDITCSDGSTAHRCVPNPCFIVENTPCFQYHWVTLDPPLLEADWKDLSCPCTGPVDAASGLNISQKYDIQLTYNNPLKCVSFSGADHKYDVDMSPLNGTWILRDHQTEGCIVWRELDLSGYQAPGRSCHGIPVCLETRRTTTATSDLLGRPITYCTHEFHEYFVTKIFIILGSAEVGVFFDVSSYKVGSDLFIPDLSGNGPQFQNCETWPEIVNRGTCILSGNGGGPGGQKGINMEAGDRTAFDSSLRARTCLGSEFCWTEAFDDMSTGEMPPWLQGALGCVFGQGKVIQSCLSLVCAA